MSTVPDVSVCCKVTIARDGAPRITRWVDDGPLSEVIADALSLSGRRNQDADGWTITVKREGHDA